VLHATESVLHAALEEARQLFLVRNDAAPIGARGPEAIPNVLTTYLAEQQEMPEIRVDCSLLIKTLFHSVKTLSILFPTAVKMVRDLQDRAANLHPFVEEQQESHARLAESRWASPQTDLSSLSAASRDDGNLNILRDDGELKRAVPTNLPCRYGGARRALQPRPNRVDKGKVELLFDRDGRRKRAVSVQVAMRYGGVSLRQLYDIFKKGRIATEGKAQQRKVLVKSLLAYFPPEK
jgi:hypothetical protein